MDTGRLLEYLFQFGLFSAVEDCGTGEDSDINEFCL